MINIHYVLTKDNLTLQGVEYASAKKDVCVLFIHGMSGNFIKDYFAHVVGETLIKEGVGFIYCHNRGYSHINDIATSEIKKRDGYKTKRFGATYEIFTDCLFDIDAWLKEVRKLGYKHIILMGHSLGCNKVIYYFSQRKPKDVIGIILASPPDLVGLIKKPGYQANSEELFKEANNNFANGEPRRLLSAMIWDDYSLSSQTFLSLFSQETEADNLPLWRNPNDFKQLASINIPILSFMGEHDDIVIRSIKDDLQLIASKAANSPKFVQKIIPKAYHSYNGFEKGVAECVCDWIKKL